MAEIRGFRASRFTAEAGPLAQLIAPPSETISPEQRARLAQEPNNIVHATLPLAESDDRSKFVRYARASAYLAGWRRGKLLQTDAAPAMYRATIELPGEKQAFLLALVPVAQLAPESGASSPVREREDRLRLLEATRAHFEPIGVEVDLDELNAVLLNAAVAELLHAVGGDGVAVTLASLTSPDAQTRIAELLSGVALRPTTGRSMVEAALAFRNALGERAGPVAEDYVPVAITGSAGVLPSGLVLWSLGDFE